MLQQTNTPELTVIVPFHNEEKTIGVMVKDLLQSCGNSLQVIYVDDGSTDASRSVVQRYLRDQDLLLTKNNEGKGSAIRVAIPYARGLYTVIQDADTEYAPKDLVRMLHIARNDKETCVIGMRPLAALCSWRHCLFFIGGWTLTRLFNILYGTRLHDQPCCYKLVRTDILQSIHFLQDDFRFDIEWTAQIALRNIPFREISVSYIPRTSEEGKKICWLDWFKGVWFMVKMRFNFV